MHDRGKAVAGVMFELGKALFPRGYVKDVYAWEDGDNHLRWAWVMEPDKLRRAIAYGEIGGEYHTGTLPFRWEYATHLLRQLGLKKAADAWQWERGAATASSFLERAANLAYDLVPEGEPYEFFNATFIPTPGYPWPNDYYSARKKKVLDGSQRPEWLYPENIVEAARSINSPGVDLCKLLGPVDGYQMEAEIADITKRDYMVVTHSMGTIDNMTRKGSWKENAEFINQCGGLLFPSLAVGPAPATNFGPFVMVADVGIVLRSLKPYLPRMSRPPAYVYNTDVWSMTTGTFFVDGAVSAFEQMTGDSDWSYYLDMNVWPLGAPQAPELHGPEIATRLQRVAQLKRAVKDRVYAYPRGMEVDELFETRLRHEDGALRYWYVEAKVNGVMEMSSFPMAVAPEQAVDQFEGFLDDVGFDGELVTVELPEEILAAMMPETNPVGGWEMKRRVQQWANLEYAYHVADAIREHGRTLERF